MYYHFFLLSVWRAKNMFQDFSVRCLTLSGWCITIKFRFSGELHHKNVLIVNSCLLSNANLANCRASLVITGSSISLQNL